MSGGTPIAGGDMDSRGGCSRIYLLGRCGRRGRGRLYIVYILGPKAATAKRRQTQRRRSRDKGRRSRTRGRSRRSRSQRRQRNGAALRGRRSRGQIRGEIGEHAASVTGHKQETARAKIAQRPPRVPFAHASAERQIGNRQRDRGAAFIGSRRNHQRQPQRGAVHMRQKGLDPPGGNRHGRRVSENTSRAKHKLGQKTQPVATAGFTDQSGEPLAGAEAAAEAVLAAEEGTATEPPGTMTEPETLSSPPAAGDPPPAAAPAAAAAADSIEPSRNARSLRNLLGLIRPVFTHPAARRK